MKTTLARCLALAALALAFHESHAGGVSFSFTFGAPIVVAPAPVCPPAPCVVNVPRVHLSPVPVFAPPRLVTVWSPPACSPTPVVVVAPPFSGPRFARHPHYGHRAHVHAHR